MVLSRQAAALAAVVVALLAAGTAGAVRSGTSTSPDIGSLVLSGSDVPGATTLFSTPVTVGGAPTYMTSLLPHGRSPYIVAAILTQAQDADTAAAALTAIDQYSRTIEGRAALAKSFVHGTAQLWSSPEIRRLFQLKGKITIKNVSVGVSSRPSPSIVVFPMTATLGTTRLHYTMAYLQVDRMLEVVETIRPKSPAPRSALNQVIAKARARLLAGYSIKNTAPPFIFGSPVAGMSLSADYGAWSGGATAFSYAWERCAPDGSSCTPVDGATSSSYTVTSADAGFKLRCVVTAANAVSSAQSPSTQTGVAS